MRAPSAAAMKASAVTSRSSGLTKEAMAPRNIARSWARTSRSTRAHRSRRHLARAEAPPADGQRRALARRARLPPAARLPRRSAGPGLRLDGSWSGTETESGSLKYISASFSGPSGSLTYQRALSITVPVRDVAQQKASVRFSVQTGAGPRYYQGRWDGQKLTGTLSTDPGGKSPVGTFELSPG